MIFVILLTPTPFSTPKTQKCRNFVPSFWFENWEISNSVYIFLYISVVSILEIDVSADLPKWCWTKSRPLGYFAAGKVGRRGWSCKSAHFLFTETLNFTLTPFSIFSFNNCCCWVVVSPSCTWAAQSFRVKSGINNIAWFFLLLVTSIDLELTPSPCQIVKLDDIEQQQCSGAAKCRVA